MNFFVHFVFISMVSIGTEINTQSLPCNVTVLTSNIKLTLYNADNPVTGVALNPATYSSVKIGDLTTFIIHGWLQDPTKPWMQLMKDTYLNKGPNNVVLVDWSFYSGIDFHSAACAVPYVGAFIGDVIYDLTQIGVDLAKVQLNGFSYGAHIAGAAGQRVLQLSGSKVNRINGLEATSLEFYGKPINERLDASDAVFVQAIHTDIDGFGYPTDYGTIDFYVNSNILECGATQQGCPLNPGIPTGGSPLPIIFCDHVRSIAYYIESINSNQFLGVTCSNCFNFATGSCNSNPKTIMGEMCPFNQNGVRYLNTNSMSPFAQG